MPNRLAHEASAYLKQHANNPVDWFPWGPEALEKAKREDKPIFLSIGYSACHWCHVMEHESFSNDAIAATLNTQFVPIKVDREERPDLDQVYQTVVQLLGRSGGWPLSVFLTPDQAPFFGGTYFPPAPKYGMPSFGEVLKAVRDAYDTKRDDVKLQADDLTRAITKIGEGAGGAAPIALDRTLLAQAAKKLVSRFDDEHGGFGARPKFPNTMNVEVLLRRAVLDRDTDCEARVKRALDGMADGGIHDQLAGGFHRYSTDEKWLVPHFEKMLYDNALLLRLYVDAGRALDRGAYLDVARKIADYLLREMQSPTGAFYATQDADSEGEEGRHFVWTPDDVDAAVSTELGRTIVKTHFGIKPGGNFERTGATVLSIAEPLDRIVVKLGLPPSEVDAALAVAMGEMLAARERREKPFRDEKMLAAWNGLAIGALAEAGLALGEPRYVDAAKRALTDVLARLEHDGRVDRYFTADGHVARPGFLDDHANLANAALDVAEATGDTSWVAVARRIADVIVARFDDGDGGFTFAPRDGEKLLATMRDPWDQATPSGGSMTALLLLRLGVLVGGAYATTAEKMLEKMSGRALENPFGCGQMLCVIDRLVRGSVDVVIVGEPGPARDALHAAAGARWIPNRNLVVTTPADAHIAGALAAEKPGPKDGGALAYVCRDRACGAPVSTADALARSLG